MSPTDAYSVAKQTLLVLSPEILIILMATAMMTLGAFIRQPRSSWAGAAVWTLAAAACLLFLGRSVQPDPYAAVALNDGCSLVWRLGFLLTGILIIGLAHDQVDDARGAEFFGALLMIHAGAMIVAAANDLVLLFAGLELVSIPTYLILYLPRRDRTTLEAATKYFYLSIFSSALLLFGLAYLYGIAGVSNLKAMSFVLHWEKNTLATPAPQIGVIAAVFVIAGLAFRVAAVPFHFYAPDVYQGSPLAVVALLAWVPKAIGFVALLRVVSAVFGWSPEFGSANLATVSDKAVAIAWVVAVATMTLGNTVALIQEDLKRFFAYSSIAHAGYLMVGVAASLRNPPIEVASASAVSQVGFLGAYGVTFHLAAYALMTLGAFAVFIALSTPERTVERISDLSGLASTHPWSFLALTLCLLSLTGVPPLAGFLGKFWLFGSALAAARGDDAPVFLSLTIIAVLNAAVGAYYYLRIIVTMAFAPPPSEPLLGRPAWPTWSVVTICAGLSLVLGIYPAPLSRAARVAATAAVTLPPPQADTDLRTAGSIRLGNANR